MGGPVLSVLTPYTAERVEPIVVEEMLAQGLTRYEQDPTLWHRADNLPYGYDLQSPALETDPEELAEIERVTGARMCCDVLLHIFVSDVAGRPTLARLARHVAQRAQGWVFVEFNSWPSED